jgi:hypothetical protein
MISFKCRTKLLKDTLMALKKVHKRRQFAQIYENCEITLTDGYVKLAIPGAICGFKCETKGTAKASLAYSKLYSIVDHHGWEDLRVEFYDESLRFGVVQIKAKTVFFTDDKVLRTIVLPNNYTDLDLLLLKNEGYTKEELEFNNLSHLIDMAERKVYYNLRRASLYLRDYGLMPKDIKKLVTEKLGIRLDLDEKEMKLLLGKD